MNPKALDRKRTVMIVENDIDLRKIVTTILDFEGLDVLAAADGQEALNLLDKGKTPDLIITDMKMAGMDGHDFYIKLKNNSQTKDVPVIIISGMDDLEKKTKLMGANIFLKKPYSLDTFTALVKKHLH